MPLNYFKCEGFNVHHSLWGSGKSTSRGIGLVKDFVKTDLCLGNDGSATFFLPTSALTPLISLSTFPTYRCLEKWYLIQMGAIIFLFSFA